MRKPLLLLFTLCVIAARVVGQVLGTPVVTWDFANGIPSDWTLGINSTNDLAHWEYRGPSTTPDFTVGARGACSAIAQPIPSLTQSNGFVIFDGNYWDDAGTSCGAGIGTGLDPAPHTAWLITPPIDLTAVTGAVLTFQQQYRHFQATTKVEISTDGGTNWVELINNVGPQSPNAEWKSVNISALAVGESSVQFRFIYQGTYYWWLLDDITVFEPNQNDLILSGPKYTTNTGPDSQNALVNLEYDQYPLLMIPPFTFKAKATNVGVQIQNNLELNARIIRDGSTEVYNANSPTVDLGPASVQNFTISPPYTNAPIVGDYTIYYSVVQDEEDQTPLNNIDSLDYSITDYTYAYDEGFMDNSYLPSAFYQDYRMEAGNFYEAFYPNTFCHSIQVAVAEGTEIGAGITGYIYNQSMDSLLAVCDTMYVNAANLNGVGEANMMTIPLIEPFELLEDSIYFVCLSEADSSQIIHIARSGVSSGESSLVRFPAINATLISNFIPMVRMNIFGATDLPGCTDLTASNFNPNALVNDGSCEYPGCTFENADNFSPLANFDDGSCVIGGCLDPEAANYTPNVNYDNGSCQYPGCLDGTAINYNPNSNIDDGSCLFLHPNLHVDQLSGCAPFTFHVANNSQFAENSTCVYFLNSDILNQDCLPDLDYTITTPGSYELTYSFTVNTASADTVIFIEVFAPPVLPALTYNATSYEISCDNCGSNDYVWYFEGEELVGSDNGPIGIFFNDNYQNGHYSVVAENSNGCTTNSDELLLVQPIFFTNVTEACAPLTLTASDLSSLLPGTTMTIDFGDGSLPMAFENAQTHSYVDPGNFTIVVAATLDGVTGTYSQPIEVFEVLTPILEHDFINHVVVCSNCDQFEGVEWNIDGTTFNGIGPFSDAAQLFTVTGITVNGCSASALMLMPGVGETNIADLQIYPVPADEHLILQSKGSNVKLNYVTDFGGRIIEVPIKTRTNGLTLNTSSLPAGLYSMSIQVDGQTINRVISITH